MDDFVSAMSENNWRKNWLHYISILHRVASSGETCMTTWHHVLIPRNNYMPLTSVICIRFQPITLSHQSMRQYCKHSWNITEMLLETEPFATNEKFSNFPFMQPRNKCKKREFVTEIWQDWALTIDGERSRLLVVADCIDWLAYVTARVLGHKTFDSQLQTTRAGIFNDDPVVFLEKWFQRWYLVQNHNNGDGIEPRRKHNFSATATKPVDHDQW